MLDRHDLTDEEWALLAPLLPSGPGRGGRWADHRKTINGVFWRTRAGAAWRDVPPEYGKWITVYKRHWRWSLDGTWARVLDVLRTGVSARPKAVTGRWAWTPPSRVLIITPPELAAHPSLSMGR